METKQENLTPKRNNPAAQLLVAALAYTAMVFAVKYLILSAAMLPYLAEIVMYLIVLMPMPCIYIGARRGWWLGFFFTVFCAVIGYLVVGLPALYVFGVLCPIILICAIVIRKKMGAYDSLVLSCGAALLSVALVAGYIYLISGTDPVTYLFNYLKNLLATDQNFAVSMYPIFALVDILNGVTTVDKAFGLSTQQMIQYVNAQPQITLLQELIATSVPTTAMNFVMYSGICSFFIPRALVKKTGGEVSKVPPFSRFALPKSTGIYFIITLVLAMIPSLLNITNLALAGDVLFQVVSIVFSIVGLAFADFLLRLRIKSTPGRVFLLILLWLIVPTLLMWMGVLEQLVRFRDRAFASGGRV